MRNEKGGAVSGHVKLQKHSIGPKLMTDSFRRVCDGRGSPDIGRIMRKLIKILFKDLQCVGGVFNVKRQNYQVILANVFISVEWPFNPDALFNTTSDGRNIESLGELSQTKQIQWPADDWDNKINATETVTAVSKVKTH
ncbi:hypothetical protein CDAR_49521 [Caerostris darwini]|uniref:Uncharacterized protein n=1 Tax=Caerostris darwini TaxID=1538125 RepID=A0AAV4PE89_9ARAC|nr:hypothetical protein CDAR_49521 [Caerostris darwini]